MYSGVNQPYIPMTFEELNEVDTSKGILQFLQRTRIVGKVFEENTEGQVNRQAHFRSFDVIILSNPIGKESQRCKILLDFELVPHMKVKLNNGDIIQVMGELKIEKVDVFSLIVHIIRDFSNVDLVRYHEAISLQSPACPKISLHEPDPNNFSSPPPSAFGASFQGDTKNLSKDLFEESDDEQMVQ